jgi:hypothetical protein
MKVRQNRLLALLNGHGFVLGPQSRTDNSLIFIKPSHIEDLFESIILNSQGKRGEAVYASVGIAVTRQVAYKVLGDVQFLHELGEDPTRGWTIIEDDRKARQWEAQLANVAPVRARDWADARGAKVLRDTAEIRTAVDKYLSLVHPIHDLGQVLANLKQASSEQTSAEAERLHACPILRGVTGAEVAYEVACYLIVRHAQDVEGLSYLGSDPIGDKRLMHRVIVLADKLHFGPDRGSVSQMACH